MDESTIYSNEYIKIFANPEGVFIETFKKGIPIEWVNTLLSSHPEIDVVYHAALKNSIFFAPKPPEKIGNLKKRISIDIINDGLTAVITYNFSDEELALKNRENLVKETLEKLSEKGVVFGLRKEVLAGEIQSGKPYIIAEGISPMDGTDCKLKLYELEEVKPKVYEDGKVDFYELQLINRVKAGDWLGERIEATEGIPGKTVKGLVMSPIKGKTFPLYYDRNTVLEIIENQKTTLYSRIDGAVNYSDGIMSVSNHLEIDGDIDFRTGNIKFDGYLTIKGTVTDGFSIEATKDIEINGLLGLGNVKGITSTQGSVFIKGGIFAKSGTEVKAAKDVYAKFLDSVTVTCGGSVHIGYYSKNSVITANEVIMDSSNGQIIGGSINARIRVEVPILGSEIEKKTVVEVAGFDRNAFKKELDDIFRKISDLKKEQHLLKQQLTRFDGIGALNAFQRKEYNDLFEKMLDTRNELRVTEEKRKNIADYLKTKGEGEINVTKKLYPNCTLIIKKNTIEIPSAMLVTSFFVQDNEIKRV